MSIAALPQESLPLLSIAHYRTSQQQEVEAPGSHKAGTRTRRGSSWGGTPPRQKPSKQLKYIWKRSKRLRIEENE